MRFVLRGIASGAIVGLGAGFVVGGTLGRIVATSAVSVSLLAATVFAATSIAIAYAQ